MKIFILFIMLFFHIVDDYYLQGLLAQLKQKSWWEKNASHSLYRNDYKVALVEHGFSWSFMIMLPIMVWMIYINNIFVILYCILFFTNMIIHSFVDNLKANVGNCSLLVDQTIHICQILITWAIVFDIIQ